MNVICALMTIVTIVMLIFMCYGLIVCVCVLILLFVMYNMFNGSFDCNRWNNSNKRKQLNKWTWRTFDTYKSDYKQIKWVAAQLRHTCDSSLVQCNAGTCLFIFWSSVCMCMAITSVSD